MTWAVSWQRARARALVARALPRVGSAVSVCSRRPLQYTPSRPLAGNHANTQCVVLPRAQLLLPSAVCCGAVRVLTAHLAPLPLPPLTVPPTRSIPEVIGDINGYMVTANATKAAIGNNFFSIIQQGHTWATGGR